MAVSYTDKAGRQRILEGLWLIGIEPGQLNVSSDLEGQAFLDALHRNGVHDQFIGRAMAAVEWRVGKGASLMMKVADLLRVSGYRPDEIERFEQRAIGGKDDAGYLNRVLTEQFNERTAGAMVHKVTGGQTPQGTVWNPFRTDVPPKQVDTKFGGGGMLATQVTQDLAAGPAGTRVPQLGQLPTPPTPVQQKQQAAPAPGAPTIGGTTPGAGGPGTPGAGGPGPSAGIPPPKPLTPAERKANLEGTYGWAAVFMDDPEVAVIINDVMAGKISDSEADRRWRNTAFYKRTTTAERAWAILEKSDPADAAEQLQGQIDSIMTQARGLGFQIAPDRARQIAVTSKKYGWSDQEINSALASEIRYDPQGAKTGVLAQIKAAQQNQLVPLSDQAMTQWAQAIVGGTRSLDDFQAYLKDQAKSLFPTIATSLDAMTVRQYLNPYEETIKKTLGQTEIDWSDPKWFRFVNTADEKGQRKVMDIADVQRTIITDPQYGYDKTEKGKQAKADLARTILEDFGFVSATQQRGSAF